MRKERWERERDGGNRKDEERGRRREKGGERNGEEKNVDKATTMHACAMQGRAH